MSLQPFPALPHDVERLVMERAALDDRSVALKLVGVSQKVQAWIDPILYEEVKLEYSAQAKAFVHTLESSRKHRGFFATHVKVLSFAYGIDIGDAVKVLSACRGVKNLASWLELSQISADYTNSDLDSFSELLTPGSLRLHRLSVILHDFTCVPDPDFTNPVLQQVTHLDIFQGSDYFRDWSWTGFDQLSQLTHLSFDLSISSPLEIVVDLLPHLPTHLKTCLVMLSTRDSSTNIDQFCAGSEGLLDIAAGKVDPRLVVGTNEPIDDDHGGLILVHLHSDFGRDEQDDIWYKADLIRAKRKQGS